MTLLLLYGPPAVGKLTVAKHIVAKTSFKLFDNHASIDLAMRVFEWGHPSFGRTVNAIRMLIFEEAAKADTNLLFTLAYAHPADMPDIKRIIDVTEKNGGKVVLVNLICSRESLLKRVTDPSRHAKKAIQDPAFLAELLDSYDLFSSYPEQESYRINTDVKSAEEAALDIIDMLARLKE